MGPERAACMRSACGSLVDCGERGESASTGAACGEGQQAAKRRQQATSASKRSNPCPPLYARGGSSSSRLQAWKGAGLAPFAWKARLR